MHSICSLFKIVSGKSLLHLHHIIVHSLGLIPFLLDRKDRWPTRGVTEAGLLAQHSQLNFEL